MTDESTAIRPRVTPQDLTHVLIGVSCGVLGAAIVLVLAVSTEGVFTPQGEFLPLPKPANSILKDIEERFRRFLLKRLHRAERLSEEFMNRLLQWNPS